MKKPPATTKAEKRYSADGLPTYMYGTGGGWALVPRSEAKRNEEPACRQRQVLHTAATNAQQRSSAHSPKADTRLVDI